MADQSEQGGGISYNPSHLPPPITLTDTYLKAVLVELRLLNRQLKSLIASQDKATQAQVRATQAAQQATKTASKAKK